MNSSPYPPPPQPQRSSTGKWLGIGCLVLLALLVVGGFIAYALVKTFLTGVLEKYTDPQPRALPQLAMSADAASAVCARVDAFQAAMAAGKTPEPLALSGADINALIKYHPNWSNAAGNVYVSIASDKIRGDVSIPLDALTPMTKGRYLNGSGVISVQLMSGRLALFLDQIEVKGKQVPEEFMKAFRNENLAKGVNENPKTAESLARLESIAVQGDRIVITPKKAP